MVSASAKKPGNKEGRMARTLNEDKIIKADIINGPGKWDMMLAVFDGRPVTFSFTADYVRLNDFEFRITGGNFVDRDREVFSFCVHFPISPDGRHTTPETGQINLKTRKGYIRLTHKENQYEFYQNHEPVPRLF